MCQGWCVSLVAGLDWTVSYRAQLHVPRAPRPRHVVTWPGNYHPISAHLSQTQQTFKFGTGSYFHHLSHSNKREDDDNNFISPNNDQFEFWCHGLMQILVLLPSSQWWGDVTSSPDTMLWFYLHKWKLNCNLIKQYLNTTRTLQHEIATVEGLQIIFLTFDIIPSDLVVPGWELLSLGAPASATLSRLLLSRIWCCATL